MVVAGLAATAMAAPALPASASPSVPQDGTGTPSFHWHQNDHHDVLPGTHNWYEAGFDSYFSQPDAATASWTGITSWALTGRDDGQSATTPDWIKLEDIFEINGPTLSGCTGGLPPGFTCEFSWGTQRAVYSPDPEKNTLGVYHGWTKVNLGGQLFDHHAEWANGTFHVGSNTYAATASLACNASAGCS
jgi:hypothetical protein